MNVDELVDQFCEVDNQIKALEVRKAKLKEALIPIAEASKTSRLQSSTGNKVRMQVNHYINADRLKQAISVAMWNRITKRTTVKALIDAEIARGKLSEDVVKDSREPGKPTIIQC